MFFINKVYELASSNKSEMLKVFVMIPVMLVAIGTEFYQKYTAGQFKEQNLKYEKQIEVLDDVQASIDNLKLFVAKQKNQLTEQQAIVEKLKSEQEILKPVVEADKQVVEALFKLQAQQNKTNVWVDRFIGFLLGIAGSLIASVIFSTVRRERHNKLNQPNADASAD